MEAPPADVLVLGAGVIGTAIAWRLAQSGLRVRMVDAGILGGEASSASAGMLMAGGESDGPSVWLDLALQGIRLYPRFVSELVSESDQAIDFQMCGSIRIVVGEEDLSGAAQQAGFHSGLGIRVERVSRGFLYPDDGFVAPVDLLRALRRACEIRKVLVQENCRVSEIESTAYGAVVVAAGAWSSQIQVQHAGRLLKLPGTLPVKGHLIGFQLEPGILGPMLHCGHTYLLQRTNGFVVAGSTEERVGFDREINLAISEDIHRRAAKLFSPLGDAIPVSRWIGFRPYPISGEGPHIGRVEGTNVWLAYGHHRNGVLLAPLTAERIAREIVVTNVRI
jgi:glycine oxidase